MIDVITTSYKNIKDNLFTGLVAYSSIFKKSIHQRHGIIKAYSSKTWYHKKFFLLKLYYNYRIRELNIR